MLSEKYHFDLASVHFLPLQSVTNIVSAIAGNQADAGVGPAAAVLPAVQRGDAKLLGFVGDEATSIRATRRSSRDGKAIRGRF